MKQWKSYVLAMFALAALTVVGAFTAKPVLAQIRAALVQDVDNAARHFVQVSFLARQPSSGSATTSVCNNVYTVPAGQRLVVDNLGIRTEIASSNLVTLAQTFTTSSIGCVPFTLQYEFIERKPIVLLPVLFQGTHSGSFGIYGNNQSVQVYVDAGQVLSVEIDANVPFDNGTLFDVTMSGHLVSLP